MKYERFPILNCKCYLEYQQDPEKQNGPVDTEKHENTRVEANSEQYCQDERQRPYNNAEEAATYLKQELAVKGDIL